MHEFCYSCLVFVFTGKSRQIHVPSRASVNNSFTTWLQSGDVKVVKKIRCSRTQFLRLNFNK